MKTKPLFDIAQFEAERQALEAKYNREFKLYGGRHHARYLPDDIPVHVISKVFQGRYLLRPNRRLRRIITGVIGRGQRVYPDVKLYVAAFLSNHFHAMLSGPAVQLTAFVGYVKREISSRWGRDSEVNWPGSMWSGYLATALPSASSQVQCLRYILSHGVKEGLVGRPERWPGFHSAKALMTGATMVGKWFNGTAYARATDAQSRRKRPKKVRRAEYWETYEVEHAPIPAWADDSPEEYQEKVKEMVEEIVKEGSKARNGRRPLGRRKVLAIPLNHRSELPAQPWFEDRRRMICWGSPREPEVAQYIDDYWRFQDEFQSASRAYREGAVNVVYPEHALLPGGYHPPSLVRRTAA